MLSEGAPAAGDGVGVGSTTEQLGSGGDRVDGSSSARAPDARPAADPQAGQGDVGAPKEARRGNVNPNNEDDYYMRLERALLTYGPDEPDRWDRIGAAVGGGKTAADVKQFYDQLLEDLNSLEAESPSRVGTNKLLITILSVVLFSFFCQLVLLKFRAE